MEEKWMEIRKSGDFSALGKALNLDPVVARVLRNRDLETLEAMRDFMEIDENKLHDPRLLKDGLPGAEILAGKVKEQKKIRIIGDYDSDGINASYILVDGLNRVGANVDVMIPHRIQDGYGISEDLVKRAVEDEVDTIVTCDNGIAALDAIAYGKEQGLTIIVTDHHDIPYETKGEERIYLRSKADAIINPKEKGCEYPYKELCGAAVAWKFLHLVYEALGKDTKSLMDYIENVAIASITDVMELTGENRVLVKLGLKALEHTKNLGLHALLLQSELWGKTLNSFHVGFIIGPCLNASGRLDTAKDSLDLLLTKEGVVAAAKAKDLISINDSRKNMTKVELEKAYEIIAERSYDKDKVMVVELDECHESLAGIIAGRIREKYHKPVFVLTKGEEGIKGSGRSIEEYSMFEEMNKIPELFTKFGGHPMAAGLSTKKEYVPMIREKLNENATLTPEDFIEKVKLDMVLPIAYPSKKLIEDLHKLEPFGKGNPKPLFGAGKLTPFACRILGNQKNVLKLKLKDENNLECEAIMFQNMEELLEDIEKKYGKEEKDKIFGYGKHQVRLAIVYEPTLNVFGNRETIQLTIKKYKVV